MKEELKISDETREIVQDYLDYRERRQKSKLRKKYGSMVPGRQEADKVKHLVKELNDIAAQAKELQLRIQLIETEGLKAEKVSVIKEYLNKMDKGFDELADFHRTLISAVK